MTNGKYSQKSVLILHVRALGLFEGSIPEAAQLAGRTSLGLVGLGLNPTLWITVSSKSCFSCKISLRNLETGRPTDYVNPTLRSLLVVRIREN